MAYTNYTAAGTSYGNLTPQEEMQAQIAARMSSQAAQADQADRAQRMADEAKKRQADAANDPFANQFSPDQFAFGSAGTPAQAQAQVLTKLMPPAATGGGGAAPMPQPLPWEPAPIPRGTPMTEGGSAPGDPSQYKDTGDGSYGTNAYFVNRDISRANRDTIVAQQQQTARRIQNKIDAENQLRHAAGLSTAVGRAGFGGQGSGGGFTESVGPDGTGFDRQTIPGDAGPLSGAAGPGGAAMSQEDPLGEPAMLRNAIVGWMAGDEKGPMPDATAIHKAFLQRKLDDQENAAKLKTPAAGTISPSDQSTYDAAIANNKSPSQAAADIQATHEYAQVAPLMQDSIARIRKSITSNLLTYDSEDVQNTLKLYNDALKKARTIGVTPKAQQLIVDDMQNAMRDAMTQFGFGPKDERWKDLGL